MTATNIGALRIILGADAGGIEKGVKGAISSLFTLRNAVGVLAVGGMAAFVRQSVKMAAEIDDTSQRLGISTKSFQELSYAAQIAGVGQEDFTKALEQFNKRMGDFSGNVSEAQKALGQLGLRIEDLRGLSPDQQFAKIADGISKIEDPAKRAAIAADLFGKSGIKLLPVLADGSAGLRKYADEAHRLGFILSDETIKKAAEADDEFDRIGKSLKVAGVNIAAGFLPALTELRKIFTSQDFQDGVKKISSALSDLIVLMVNNKETIIQVTTAFVGMRMGAAAGGAAFGRLGAQIGALGGGIAGLVAGTELSRSELSKLEGELDRVRKGIASYQAQKLVFPNDVELQEDLNSALSKEADLVKKIAAEKERIAANAAVTPTRVMVDSGNNTFDPAIEQQINNLIFKTQVLKGEFDKLAPGFPELANGLRQFGMAGSEARTSVEQLSPHLVTLNQRQMEYWAAQQIQDSLSPYEKMAQDLAKLDLAFQNNLMTQEQFGKASQKIAEQYQAHWTQVVPSAVSGFQQLAAEWGKSNAKMAKVAQALAVVEAVINTYVAFTKALASSPPPLNYVAAAGVLAAGMAKVMAIKSQNIPQAAAFTGGSFTVPGSGAPDSKKMLMHLSPGEQVDIWRPGEGTSDPRGGASAPAQVTLQLQGRSFDREQLRELIDRLNEMSADGYRLQVA